MTKHAEVDNIFQPMRPTDGPGCAISIRHLGVVDYEQQYGMADLDHAIHVSPTTVFHAASVAKQFTAMCICLLVAQGKLALTDDVRTHLPATDLPAVTDPIQIVQILRHVSGIRDDLVLATMAGWRLHEDLLTQQDALSLIGQTSALDFKPGTKINYSNSGFTLAGKIVETISGMSLADFAKANIFDPLKMAHTSFTPSYRGIVKNRACGYRWLPFSQTFEMFMPRFDLMGPTNLLTTAHDLSLWLENFETKTVGGAAALTLMEQSSVLPDGTANPFGLGLELTTHNGRRVFEHDGRDAGFRAHVMLLPDDNISVACLCNLALPEKSVPAKLARAIVDIYLDNKPGVAMSNPRPSGTVKVPLTPSVKNRDDYLGVFRSVELGFFYEIARSGPGLALLRSKYGPLTLVQDAVQPDLFTATGFSPVVQAATFTFHRSLAMKITGFTFDGPNPSAAIHQFEFKI